MFFAKGSDKSSNLINVFAPTTLRIRTSVDLTDIQAIKKNLDNIKGIEDILLILNSFSDVPNEQISNTIEKTFPMGLRVQVFPTNLLREIYDTINDPAINEHVSLYFFENPDIYNIVNLIAPSEINRPEIRLTVDTKEDFKFVSDIYRKIIDKNLYPDFKTIDVLNIIDQHQIPLTNKNIHSKPVR